MRLSLTVLLLLVALVALAVAQEQTIEDRFSTLGSQIRDFGQQLSDKTVAAFESIRDSETTQKIKSWADEYIEKLKNIGN